MAGRSDIQAGQAFVRLYAKDDLTKFLRALPGRIVSAGKVVATTFVGIGTAVTAALGAAVRHGVSSGTSLPGSSGWDHSMRGQGGRRAARLHGWEPGARYPLTLPLSRRARGNSR